MRSFAVFFLTVILVGCQTPSDTADVAPEPPTGPPQSDIHLFTLSESGASFSARITDRDGYDNQPFFTPDGTELLFTSDREGQMDTFAYDVASGTTRRVTSTLEGEYSPTVRSNAPAWFSAIRMDTSGVQELWQYPLQGGVANRVADIDRVGYHTWVGADRVLFFRLGQPNTLQLVLEGSADTTLVATDVGRSLHKIPGEPGSSFTQNGPDELTEIVRYDWATAEKRTITAAFEGHQDYAWTPKGEILMAVEGQLVRYSPQESSDWQEIGDLGLQGTSRIAVSVDGKFLAVVAERDD